MILKKCECRCNEQNIFIKDKEAVWRKFFKTDKVRASRYNIDEEQKYDARVCIMSENATDTFIRLNLHSWEVSIISQFCKKKNNNQKN